MTLEHSRFGVVSERIDDNRYGIILKGGQRVEATYYRTYLITTLDVNQHVFLEQVPGSELWMITSHAFGNPADPGSMGWFLLDDDIFGMIDGPGRLCPS